MLCAFCSLRFRLERKLAEQKTRAKHITPPPAPQAFVKQNAQPKVLNADFKLTLSGVDQKVSVSWNNPEPVNGVFDDFEAHPDFVINSPGTANWQYIDADNQETYTWTSADFPNQGGTYGFHRVQSFKNIAFDGRLRPILSLFPEKNAYRLYSRRRK